MPLGVLTAYGGKDNRVTETYPQKHGLNCGHSKPTEWHLVRRSLSLHPQSLALLCFWLRSLSWWLHCARNLADKKQEMAWSHARDLEWHVGESSRRKAMCVTTWGCGGYKQISTVYLRVFTKASTKTWRGITVKEDCSACCYCKG